MDNSCIMFCEVWGAKEYILVACTVLAGVLSSAWASYHGDDFFMSALVGFMGMAAAFAILLVAFATPLALLAGVVGTILGAGVSLGTFLRNYRKNGKR